MRYTIFVILVLTLAPMVPTAAWEVPGGGQFGGQENGFFDRGLHWQEGGMSASEAVAVANAALESGDANLAFQGNQLLRGLMRCAKNPNNCGVID